MNKANLDRADSVSKQVDRNWQWQTWQGHSYLTCNLLSAWQHGFFTQEFYPRTPETLSSILQTQTNSYRVKQVHGNLVLTPQEINTAIKQQDLSNFLPDADAVISDCGYEALKDSQGRSPKDSASRRHRPQQSVWVASADCTPILIGDLETGRVCAIHAGWRGTAQKIVVAAIARFLEFGSQKHNLRIGIGPAIAGKMYQVDESVAIEVGKTIIADVSQKNDGEILQELEQFNNPPILADELPGKVRLDVPRVNQIQLEQLDIDPEQMATAPFCTYQKDNYFFSYRRTGEKKVQWSGIASI